MSILVLSEADVRQVLDMESCITAMEGALAGLARDELSMPLRFVVRPPTSSTNLFGLMPAHRGGDAPLYSLKEIVVTPGNSAHGLDPHQGAVLLHDGADGRLLAVVNASAITEIRTAAVSGVATRLLARTGSRRVAILGSGVQGRSHVEAMRAVVPDADIVIWSRTRANAEGLAAATGSAIAETVEGALDGADVVCTTTASREPIVRHEWFAPGAHINAVGSSISSARELDTATIAACALFGDRRESVVNEGGDFLLAADEAGLAPDHIRAELGELLIGAAEGRTSQTELTVFKSLGLAVEDLAAAALCVERARNAGLGTEVAF